jgi:hypothetical protein
LSTQETNANHYTIGIEWQYWRDLYVVYRGSLFDRRKQKAESSWQYTPENADEESGEQRVQRVDKLSLPARQ